MCEPQKQLIIPVKSNKGKSMIISRTSVLGLVLGTTNVESPVMQASDDGDKIFGGLSWLIPVDGELNGHIPPSACVHHSLLQVHS